MIISVKSVIDQERGDASVRLADLVSRNPPENPEVEIFKQERDGYRPSKHYPRLKLGLPLDWGMNPFSDVHWAFQLNAMRPVVPYLFAHARSNKVEHLCPAIDYFLDWQEFNVNKNAPNKFKWYNMAVGQRATRLAYSISAACVHEDAVGATRIDTLIQLALKHLPVLTNPEQISRGNHGLFQMHGLMSLGRILRECDEGKRAMEFARTMLDRLTLLQFSEEGVHLEHSPAYHFFATEVLSTIYDTGWYSEDSHFNKSRDLIDRAADWLVDPLGNVIPLGDSHRSRKQTESPKGESVVFRRSPWANAVARHWSKTGYSIVRSSPDAPPHDAYMLFFTGAHHSSVHKHSDDLHLEWFDRGSAILVDSGAYSYKRDEMRRYVLSTRAHNTVECSGRSSPRGKEHSYGSCLLEPRYHTWGAELTGRIAHPTLGFVHGRTVLFAPGRFLAVVDSLVGRNDATFVQWWHFDPSLMVSKESCGLTLSNPNGSIRAWIDTDSPVDDCIVAYGETEPQIQGWVCTGYQKMVPAYALGIPKKGRNATFATIFCLEESEKENAKTLAERTTHGAKWVS